jgi:hypothetical protein
LSKQRAGLEVDVARGDVAGSGSERGAALRTVKRDSRRGSDWPKNRKPWRSPSAKRPNRPKPKRRPKPLLQRAPLHRRLLPDQAEIEQENQAEGEAELGLPRLKLDTLTRSTTRFSSPCVANQVGFLTSNDADYLTGIGIPIDEGLVPPIY